jgi:reticulon-4-interacting protein 1, mitochondrial
MYAGLKGRVGQVLGLQVTVYDNVMLSAKKEWLDEVKELETDKVVIDSQWAFEDAMSAFVPLNTGRARGKVVVTVP